MTNETWGMMLRLWLVRRTAKGLAAQHAPAVIIRGQQRSVEARTKQAAAMGITDAIMQKYDAELRRDIETYEAESEHRFQCWHFAEYSNAHEDDPDYQKNYGKPFCKHNCKCDLKCKKFRQLTDKEKTDLQWYP